MHFLIDGINCTITQLDHFLSVQFTHESIEIFQVPVLHFLDPSLMLKLISQQIVLVVNDRLLFLNVGRVAVLNVSNHLGQSSFSELFFGKGEVLPSDIFQRSYFIHVGLLQN